MAIPYDLAQLDSYSFEHMVNFLAMKTLGSGVTGFAPGPDGGRDGYMKGKAPYPTTSECWEGIWYVQSKFHRPNLSTNAQKWLLKEVVKEIKAFSENDERKIPDIWIIATNIEPSGSPKTGAYDKIVNLVRKFSPTTKVDVWGGRKILDFLVEHPTVAKEYGHFLTPGHVISELYSLLKENNNQKKSLIEHFIISQFKDLCYTKLEQAGSNNDHKPKIHELFRDLPIKSAETETEYFIMDSLVSASCNVQKISTWLNFGANWKSWSKNPKRTRIILLKGGPGQGKSTAGQYFSQIQRAAFILSDQAPTVTPQVRDIANELKIRAEQDGFWPKMPRIPLFIELKDYANWYIVKNKTAPRNIIEYICDKVNYKISFVINSNDLRSVLQMSSWFINFDGLDEVPNDLKDEIANEVIAFSNEFLPSIDADVLILCTTRPQGYSGQFDDLDASVCNLIPLTQEIALSCAEPIVRFNRSEEDGDNSLRILELAMQSPQVKEIMTTPLQSHIMAVVVRDGGRPPEKRWELFNNFYNVMKKREGLKNFPDPKISILLQEKDQLLKAIHDRLGICLHVRSEQSNGAEAALPKAEFKKLAKATTEMLMDGNIDETVDTLMEATIERLVFVNTPDSTEYVRFDIRQLQEFFAAEFIHNEVVEQVLIERLGVICSDAHWREVVHFLLSALIHYKKKTALTLASTMLYQIDNDNDNHKIKHYKKRSSVGALLVLRLAEEGLLEQDKRIRVLFNQCLAPLWFSIDYETLKKISSLRMEQSKNWLLNNMIESFLNMDFSEVISCGLLFSTMLSPQHERFPEVYNRIKLAPDYFWAFNLSSVNIDFHHKHYHNVYPWFLEIIIEKYFSSKTQKELLELAYNYLSNYSNAKVEPYEHLDIEDKYKKFLTTFISDQASSKSEIKTESSSYCFVSIVSFENDWSNTSSFSLEHTDYIENTYSYPIELFKAASEFLNTNTSSSFLCVLNIFKEHNYEIACIPSSILSMIPLNFDIAHFRNQVTLLISKGETFIDKFLSTKLINGRKVAPECMYIKYTDDPFNSYKWENLCNDYPDFALRVITAPYFERENVQDALNKNKIEMLAPVVSIAKNHPEVFAKYYFLWNDVFEAFPDEAEEIKKGILDISEEKMYKPAYHSFFNSIYKINHPEEIGFLPFLAYAIVSSRPMFERSKKKFSSELASGFLEAFGVNFKTLIDIVRDESKSDLLRASSLSLLINQDFTDKSVAINFFFENELDTFSFKLYSKRNKYLLTNAITYLLEDVIIINEQLQEFLGQYSFISKNSMSCRYLLQNVYDKWRERSGTVVSNSNKLEQWLSE